jgi:epoxyqueuosine reductase
MKTSGNKSVSGLIKEFAFDLGFDLCGFAPAKALTGHAAVLKDWSESGMNAGMNYLGQNIGKRTDPRLIFEGAQSVIVVGLNYYSEMKQGGKGVPVISRYAYGSNYHDVIQARLRKMLGYIKSISSEADGKTFVDSAPILEKAWAREAGLGWPGKHSVLINKKLGSFFFLGITILNIELDYDEPHSEDHCGTCSLCIDSCPTGAINDNRTIDTRKCIAYLTLESKAPMPYELIIKLEGRAFGCDRCQEVCPWNNDAKPHRTSEFAISPEILNMSAVEWKGLSRDEFRRLFKKSAIERRTYNRFMQNIDAALKSVT